MQSTRDYAVYLGYLHMDILANMFGQIKTMDKLKLVTQLSSYMGSQLAYYRDNQIVSNALVLRN